jgi:hypothetical protein
VGSRGGGRGSMVGWLDMVWRYYVARGVRESGFRIGYHIRRDGVVRAVGQVRGGRGREWIVRWRRYVPPATSTDAQTSASSGQVSACEPSTVFAKLDLATVVLRAPAWLLASNADTLALSGWAT